MYSVNIEHSVCLWCHFFSDFVCSYRGLQLCVLPLHVQMDSRLHSDNLEKVLGIAVTGCGRVHTVLDGVVKENLRKSVASFAF